MIREYRGDWYQSAFVIECFDSGCDFVTMTVTLEVISQCFYYNRDLQWFYLHILFCYRYVYIWSNMHAQCLKWCFVGVDLCAGSVSEYKICMVSKTPWRRKAYTENEAQKVRKSKPCNIVWESLDISLLWCVLMC